MTTIGQFTPAQLRDRLEQVASSSSPDESKLEAATALHGEVVAETQRDTIARDRAVDLFESSFPWYRRWNPWDSEVESARSKLEPFGAELRADRALLTDIQRLANQTGARIRAREAEAERVRTVRTANESVRDHLAEFHDAAWGVMGSREYWENGSGRGSRRYLENGSGKGSRAYWENGTGKASRAYWENGTGKGSRAYWENGTGKGSRAYWEHGTGKGSARYWLDGTGKGSLRYRDAGIGSLPRDEDDDVDSWVWGAVLGLQADAGRLPE